MLGRLLKDRIRLYAVALGGVAALLLLVAIPLDGQARSSAGLIGHVDIDSSGFYILCAVLAVVGSAVVLPSEQRGLTILGAVILGLFVVFAAAAALITFLSVSMVNTVLCLYAYNTANQPSCGVPTSYASYFYPPAGAVALASLLGLVATILAIKIAARRPPPPASTPPPPAP